MPGPREVLRGRVVVEITYDSFREEASAGNVKFEGDFPPGCNNAIAAYMAVQGIVDILAEAMSLSSEAVFDVIKAMPRPSGELNLDGSR